jgi:hypothetical protein
MEKIDIKNFCLIIFGNKKNIAKELELIAESPVNYLTGDKVFIATFKSVLFAKDIEILLSDHKLNFIISEMIPSLFSADLGVLNEKLFNMESNPIMKYKTEDVECEVVETRIEEDLTMDELLDLISEKGLNSLTKKQKKQLNNLSTKK